MPGNASTTMIARRLGDVLLFVHGSAAPSDAEWDQAMQLYADIGPVRVRALVWTEGGAPNPAQRAKLSKVNGGAAPPLAVLTESVVARAAGTAISWFNPALRIFTPNEVERALDHLVIAPADRPGLRAALETARGELRALIGRSPRS